MTKVRRINKTFHEIYKICTVCNIEKHREEFKHVGKYRLYSDGTSRVYPKCQLCFNEENRKYWKEEERKERRAGYCVRLMKQRNKMLNGVAIPPELIELQRVRIKALRALGITHHKQKRIYD